MDVLVELVAAPAEQPVPVLGGHRGPAQVVVLDRRHADDLGGAAEGPPEERPASRSRWRPGRSAISKSPRRGQVDPGPGVHRRPLDAAPHEAALRRLDRVVDDAHLLGAGFANQVDERGEHFRVRWWRRGSAARSKATLGLMTTTSPRWTKRAMPPIASMAPRTMAGMSAPRATPRIAADAAASTANPPVGEVKCRSARLSALAVGILERERPLGRGERGPAGGGGEPGDGSHLPQEAPPRGVGAGGSGGLRGGGSDSRVRFVAHDQYSPGDSVSPVRDVVDSLPVPASAGAAASLAMRSSSAAGSRSMPAISEPRASAALSTSGAP